MGLLFGDLNIFHSQTCYLITDCLEETLRSARNPHTAGLTPSSSFTPSPLPPDNTELYTVFFLDMTSSEAPSNPMTLAGQVVYQSGLYQGLENKREFNVKA